MVTSDLGRVTTDSYYISLLGSIIVVTSDLGRVTTTLVSNLRDFVNCGDVRSRTSYNIGVIDFTLEDKIVVTSDLGRVTIITFLPSQIWKNCDDYCCMNW